MTITRQDIKILKSDNVSDFDDGGGRVTNREVVDGKSNDLFADIPDVSRAYGDVDMVKIYPAVTTQDDDALLGSVFSLGRLPEDESVNITLFTTKSWFDTRKEAIKTLESYLAPSVRIEGELLETQLKGQQVIQLIMGLNATPPTVGKSLYIIENEGKSNQFDQYIFVTAVSVAERTFRVSNSNLNFKVATVDISTKLDYNFAGVSPAQFNSSQSGSAIVRDTRVADTANYYTTKPLLESASFGAASVKVEDIFTQLVPSARQDKPMSGLNPAGVSQAVVPSGVETTIFLPSFKVSSGVAYNIGMPVTPTTLKMTLGSTTIEEKGGVLEVAGVTVGFIAYETGIITWLSAYAPAIATLTIKFLPATVIPTINDSLALEVTEGNRGLSMAWTLDTPPLAGSLVITYVVLGDIYTLRDTGAGILQGASEAFGVGRVDYSTGDVLVTFGSEPDVSSHILFTWANMNGVSNLTTTASGKLGFKHTLPPATTGRSISLPSLTITWGDKTATVSNRKVVGDATGTYNPTSGQLVIEPNILPPVGQDYSITYKQLPKYNIGWASKIGVPMSKEPFTYHDDEALILRFTLDLSDPNIIRGSFRFKFMARMMQNIPFTAAMGSRELEVYEGEEGKLFFDGGITSYDEFNLPSPSAQIEVGTINYATGVVTIVASAIRYTWWEQSFEYSLVAYGAPRYTSK